MTDERAIVKIETKKDWDEALERETWIAPKTNIFESNDSYFLVADMPGVSRDNLRVELEGDSLLLMGRINYEYLTSRNFILQENDFGNFYRKFNISDSVNKEKIEARFENGQLEVILPKHDRVKTKVIEIK